MVVPKGSVQCLLCRGAINLKAGDLGRFKSHLESVHDTLYDIDLVISLTFLEEGEKDRIVENMYPRIRSFFKSIKHSEEKLGIEKRLIEEDEEEEDNINPRKKIRKEESNNTIINNIEERNALSEADDLDQSIIDVLENDSDDESEESENDEIVTAPDISLSHCELCQLSLPLSSFTAHMELHKDEITTNNTASIDTFIGVKADSPRLDKVANKDAEKEVETDDLLDDKMFSKCEVCGKVLKKNNMSRHRKRLHGLFGGQNILEKVNAVEKDETDAGSGSVMDDTLDEAVSLLAREEDRTAVRCDICMKPMKKTSLTRHMANLHPTEKTRSGSLSVHSDSSNRITDTPPPRSESTEQEYDYRCKICFSRFQELQEVKIHVKEDHDIDYEDLEAIDDKDMKVSREGAIRKLKTELILQEKDEETTILDEEDEEVDASKSSDEKLQCDSCDFQFHRKKSLLRHIRKAHRRSHS